MGHLLSKRTSTPPFEVREHLKIESASDDAFALKRTSAPLFQVREQSEMESASRGEFALKAHIHTAFSSVRAVRSAECVSWCICSNSAHPHRLLHRLDELIQRLV